MKKVGLLIVNYNDSKNTIKLIKNVDNYKVINKIVIVDNKSTDDSLKKLSKYENDRVHIIANEENKGYADAINVGSKYLIDFLKDCYIIISNSDIEIKNEKDIIELLSNFDQEDIKCVMPKVLENGKYKYGWKLTSSGKDLLMNIPLINRLYKKKIRDYDISYLDNNTCRVDVIYGCFFIIDGKTLKEIDYLDNNTFLYYEEYILAKKLQKHNYVSVINNRVIVEHKHNATIGNNISIINKYKIYKNSQLYYEKKYNNAFTYQIILFKLFYYIGLFLLRIKLLFR